MTGARVSVVIPAYNAERHLAATLDSVLAQTLQPYEVIVVDDGSVDGTAAVAVGFGGPVRVVSQDNSGVSSARNRGFAESSGEYLAVCDADDTWRPQKLAAQIRDLSEAPGASAAFCGSLLVDEHLQKIRRGPRVDPAAVALADMIFHREGSFPEGIGSTLLLRRETADEAGAWDESLSDAADWDYGVRLRMLGPFVGPTEALMLYRVHGGQMSDGVSRRVTDALRLFDKLEGNAGVRAALGPQLEAARARQILIALKSLLKAGAPGAALGCFVRELRRHPRSVLIAAGHGFSTERIR